MQFFVDEVPAILGEIEVATQQRQARRLQVAAHRLKGLVSSYDRKDSAELCNALELLARSGSFESTASAIDLLRIQIAELFDAIQSHLAN